MKKKVIIAVCTLGVLVSAFGITYAVRTAQIDKETGNKMTSEQVAELDSYEIVEFEGTLKDDSEKTFKRIEDMKDLEAGTIIKCNIKLASGKEVETEGYITKGDHNNMSYDGNSVKITISTGEKEK